MSGSLPAQYFFKFGLSLQTSETLIFQQLAIAWPGLQWSKQRGSVCTYTDGVFCKCKVVHSPELLDVASSAGPQNTSQTLCVTVLQLFTIYFHAVEKVTSHPTYGTADREGFTYWLFPGEEKQLPPTKPHFSNCFYFCAGWSLCFLADK